MKVLNFSLNDTINSGKIISFNYSRSLNELANSWSAEIAGGNFSAGNSISFDGVLTDGVISRAYKDSTGIWHIEGKDAGIKLMKSTPDISSLPTGSAKVVIDYLANLCGITANISGDLDGFNVRSIITGSTCAEAILELAMFSGCIAFIDNDGKLNISVPSDNTPNFLNVINDTGTEFDLDGCATQVLVTINRRQWPDEENAQEIDEEKIKTYYTGSTPPKRPYTESYSGSFSNGSYSITMLEPFGVIDEAETTITDNNVTINTKEKHNYDYKVKTIWRDNQEYVLFAFIESGYTLTKTVTGSYTGGIEFSEVTTETLKRTLSVFDEINVPENWKGDIDMVSSETVTRSTIRTGAPEPKSGMPDYSPPFDSQIQRTFKRENFGRGLLCNEIETTYEMRQVGSIAPVKIISGNENETDKLVEYFFGPNGEKSNLAIQTHSTPKWVEVITHRTYYEQYNDDGECMLSTRSEYSDNGSKWLTDNALIDTGDEELNAYQKAYASFSQQSHGLEVNFKQSVISPAWQFIELQGRMKNYSANNEDGIALGNISDWYDNGEYISTEPCPHFNLSTRTCNIYSIIDNSSVINKKCERLFSGTTPGWRACSRAIKALALARAQDVAQLSPVIYASASRGEGKIGYKRDIYIDDYIKDDNTVQNIADTIANNILKVKGNKGLCKTVTIPYAPNILPNGTVITVSHDWANLQTSVTYRVNSYIPDFLISQSVADIAAIVSTRENSRQNIPQYGKIHAITYKKVLISEIYAKIAYVTVQIGNKLVSCTTKLNNLSSGDIVLVSFPSGNNLKGEIISRL